MRWFKLGVGMMAILYIFAQIFLLGPWTAWDILFVAAWGFNLGWAMYD